MAARASGKPGLLVPERAFDRRHQAGGGLRVAGGEEGHVVAAARQLFGQGGDHTFCSAIARRRHGLERWRNLGNPHLGSCVPDQLAHRVCHVDVDLVDKCA
jgi:hypothetical protein